MLSTSKTNCPAVRNVPHHLKMSFLVMHEMTDLGTFSYNLLAAHMVTCQKYLRTRYDSITMNSYDGGCFKCMVF